MAVRILTGLLLTAVLLAVVLLGPFEVLAAFLSVAILLALHEFLGLPGTLNRLDRVAGVAAGAAVLAVAGLAPELLMGRWLLATAVLSIIVLLLVVLFTPHPMESAGRRATHLVAGVVYVGLLGSCAVIIARPEHGLAGRHVLLAAAAVTWANDSMAFFGGKLLGRGGRHKMYAAVSPNKTWEGSVSGMIGSVLGAFLVKWLLHDAADPAALAAGTPVRLSDPVVLAAFALVGGAAGQVGDLAESMFKRACGVKDSGTLLPGHGGLLDRIDAYLFVAPVAWVWFYL
jgi:phosphatidate cytidylyltransferase